MGEVNKSTQIPLKAMYFFAALGAVLSLTFELTMLVEMMSIGTLLAYLCVSASIIVARYTPGDANGHQVLDDDEVQVDGQELNEMITNDGHRSTQNSFDASKASVNQIGSSTNESTEFRDGQRNQFMLWLLKHDWFHRRWRSAQELKHELVTFKLKKYAPDTLPTICVFIMIGLMFILCSIGPHLVELSQENGYYAFIILILAVMLAITFAIIALHEQNTVGLRYKVGLICNDAQLLHHLLHNQLLLIILY